MREATLCLLIDDAQAAVLLGLKKTGFGQGKIVGFGGKIEPGETVVQAALRELSEETGLVAAAHELERAAHLTFWFPARPDWNHLVHVFLVRSWQGEIRESNEARPVWFPLDRLPLGRMWTDAAWWLPRVLAGQRILGRFVFNDDNETIRQSEIHQWCAF